MKQKIEMAEVADLIHYCAEHNVNPSSLMALTAKFLTDMAVTEGKFGAVDDNNVMHVFEFSEVETYPMEIIEEKKGADVINFKKESKRTTTTKGTRSRRSTLLH